MPARLPPLPLLRLFEAAGRRQSFKLAAEELGVTASAVSHGVKTLELWLGVVLFNRGPGSVSLTAPGKEFLAYVSKGLCTIAVGTRTVLARRQDPEVRVSCAPTFASRLLMPALEQFRKRHPTIVLALDTAHEYVAPGDEVDVGIRMARRPAPGLAPKRLLAEWLVPVCSPAYLDSHADSHGRVDFSRATLLHVGTVSEDWSSWFRAAGLHRPEPNMGLQFDEIQLAFAAAAAGLGVAIGRRPLVDAELQARILVPAHDFAVASATSYWLVSSPEAEKRPAVAAFSTWILNRMKELNRQTKAQLIQG